MAAKLDDPDLQLKYLSLIRKGKPRGKAAKECDISSTTVRSYEIKNPEFREAVMDAEEDAFDPIEGTMRSLAKAGDVGMMKEYRSLKRRREAAENRKQVIDHHHTVKIDATSQVRELVQTLRERRDGVAVLEGGVEVIEVERAE